MFGVNIKEDLKDSTSYPEFQFVAVVCRHASQV